MCNPVKPIFIKQTENQEQKTMYYRRLEVGEKKIAGDLKIADYGGLCGIAFPGDAVHAGAVVLRPVDNVDEWHEIAKYGWPHREDLDKYDEVQWLTDQGYSLCVRYHFNHSAAPGYSGAYGEVTHWRRITPPKKAEEAIFVAQKPVEFLENGAVRVGCEFIDKTKMQKIVKRYKETCRDFSS
jgi:hypothetical protein